MSISIVFSPSKAQWVVSFVVFRIWRYLFSILIVRIQQLIETIKQFVIELKQEVIS